MSELHGNNGKEISGEVSERGAETEVAPSEEPFRGGTTPTYFDTRRPAVIPIPSRETQRERSGSVIAIDIDDTVAAYVAGFVREYGFPDSFERVYENKSILETSWPGVDLDLHFSEKYHQDFCLQLLPIDGAFSACHLLLRNGFPIVFLTSRPASHKEATIEWLSKWGFPVAPVYCVGGSEGKRMMMENLDITAIIDDRPEDLLAARDLGLSTFIVDRPWNREIPGLYRCFDWTQILDTIDRFWLPLG
jgi:hypothetical protein